MSSRARALLEAYRRDHAPTPEQLQQVREALAMQLRAATAPMPERAPTPTQRAPLRPRRFRAWACGGAMLLGGLALQHTNEPAATRSPVERGLPESAPAREAPAQTGSEPPRVSSVASEPAVQVERAATASGATEKAARRGTRKHPPSNGESARTVVTRAESAPPLHPQATADDADRTPPQHAAHPSHGGRLVAPTSNPRGAASLHESVDDRVTTPAYRASTSSTHDHALTLDAEVMQMRTAYDLLRSGQPLRALSALGEHARRFPNGRLHELAAVARVLALCDLGRVDAARRAADEFLSDHPRSIHAPRVRSVCRTPP